MGAGTTLLRRGLIQKPIQIVPLPPLEYFVEHRLIDLYDDTPRSGHPCSYLFGGNPPSLEADAASSSPCPAAWSVRSVRSGSEPRIEILPHFFLPSELPRAQNYPTHRSGTMSGESVAQ